MINRGIIRKSLLDVGSSINLMPYALYKKLGFTDLIPRPIQLLMANNAVVEPLGMIEDVIVKVGKAFYPAKFIVLKLESGPTMEHSLILGRPWLATAKAKIAIHTGIMKLKFVDKSLKLQIYHRAGGESLPQICRIESCCMIGTSTGSLHLDLAITDCEALHDLTFIDDTCSSKELEALMYYDNL